MKSGEIREHDPQVYPTKLWVADWHTSVCELDGRFFALGSDYKKTTIMYNVETIGDRGVAMTTVPVIDKLDNTMGCLVYINYRCPLYYAAHEASHCCDWLFDKLGIESHTWENGEARAYYVGWAAEKIINALTNK